MSKNKHIFLSYRSAEAEFALRLAADLKNAGVNLWMDRLDIRPGDDWIQALQNAVNDCAAIITVLSPDYISSKYCRRELARADRMGRPVFPVLLRPVPAQDWPFEIESRQYIDFSNWRDDASYQAQLSELVKTLKEHVANQINPIPDLETRYLTSLIAELEARKGVLEYVELSAMTDWPSGEQPIRPKPRVEESWGKSGAFTLLKGGGEGESVPDEFNILQQPRIPLDSISQAVEKYPRFVLIGAPGAGKTTTIQRLALDAARARQLNPVAAPLPLLAHLPAWNEDASVVEFLRAQWPLDSDPISLMAQGKVLLYLDGLNEMGASGSQKAVHLREWLHGSDAPQRVIVTCRLTDYTDDMELDLPTVIAEEMDEPRIRRFVTNYLGKDAASALLDRVLPEDDEDLEDSRHLFQLARNPFMLTVMILVYSSSPEHDLPRNMGALFKRLVMALWERERVRQTSGWVPLDQMEMLYSELAFAMIDENMPIYVSRDYVLQHLRSEDLLRAGISANLVSVSGTNVHFYHQLILEYLAAVGLAQVGLPTKLARPRFDRRGGRVATNWDQVIIALSGISSKPDWIVRDVAEVDPYLALECIASGIRVSETTRRNAIEHLQAFSNDDGSDGRVAAGRALGLIGEEAAVTFLLDSMRRGPWEVRQASAWVLRELRIPALPGLLEALRDWDQDIRDATATAVRQIGSAAVPVLLAVLHDEHWSMRRGAAWALGEIGDPAAVPGLVEALRDEDGLVRRETAFALGWIRDEAAVPALLEALQDKDWRVRKAAAETLGSIGLPSLNGLLGALQDSSINVRRVAAEALGRIGHKAAVPTLIEALEDNSLDVRGAAIEALGWIRTPDSVERLIACLEDTSKPKWDTRRICDIAAEALQRIDTLEALTAVHEWRQRPASGSDGSATEGDESDVNITVNRLIQSLRDEDGLKRWSAVKALAAFKDTAGINALLQALGDEDVLVCDAASEALAMIGTPAVPGLLGALDDENPNVRGAAVEALGKIGDVRAVPRLITCLTDTAKPWLLDERVCDLALKALEKIATPEALSAAEDWRLEHGTHVPATASVPGTLRGASLPELIEALHQEDWMVRQEAATALKELAKTLKGVDHVAVLQTLSSAINDAEWFVRWAVAEALAWMGDKAAVPVLLKTLNDPNWTVRVATVRALMEIGDASALPGLVDALEDHHALVREVAAEALGVLGNIQAVPSLLGVLHDQEGFVRRSAVEALGVIGESSVLPELMEKLYDAEHQVRWSAAEALGKIGDATAVGELIGHLNDTYGPDWEERRICDVVAEALEKIGTPEARNAVERWRQAQFTKE